MLAGAYTLGIELQEKLEDLDLNVKIQTESNFVHVDLIVGFVNKAELAEYLKIVQQHYEVPECDINWAMDAFDADNFVISIVVHI